MGDAWRAIEDSHIKGKGFRRIGELRDKRDFQAIYLNNELIGYGCTPKCTSIICSLTNIDDQVTVSNGSIVVRQVRTIAPGGARMNTSDVICSLGCDKYKFRDNDKKAM